MFCMMEARGTLARLAAPIRLGGGRMARQVISGLRVRSIEEALRAVEARFGPGVMHRLRDAPLRTSHDRAVASGSLGLDLATRLGGLPRGQITELVGTESSGKTALLYAALVSGQRDGGIAALIDVEGGADAEALTACGADLDDLLVARPDTAPDALLMLTILARCNGVDVLGLLSVAALRDLPSGTVRGSDGGEMTGLDTARLLARGLRVLGPALRGSRTAVVFVNDLFPHLEGHRSPGGLALRHHAALRVAVEPLALLPDGAGGYRALQTRLTVVKNKLASPGGLAEIEIALGGAIDGAAELLHLGLATGLVAREPHGLAFGAISLGLNETRARRALAADPGLAEALRAALLEAHVRPDAA